MNFNIHIMYKNLKELAFVNPFSEKRIQLEKLILKNEYQHEDYSWHIGMNQVGKRRNVELIHDILKSQVLKLSKETLHLNTLTEEQINTYQTIVNFYIYYECSDLFEAAILSEDLIEHTKKINGAYELFNSNCSTFFKHKQLKLTTLDKNHLFACFWQIRRAFHFILHGLAGRSKKAIQLRETIWQSVLTHDMNQYKNHLYKHMPHIPSLILGPSGSGKEIVANCIGLSRYIPFRNESFHSHFKDHYQAINVSSFSESLIESELFGHAKGAFTGATQDKTSWFGSSHQNGSTFIDEIGELNETIQVKLLRVLQTRSFYKVGSQKEETFHGKLIFATHQNLNNLINEGKFREDFYYRICADQIQTPSLHELIENDKENLNDILLYVLQNTFNIKSSHLIEELCSWIIDNLGLSYSWSGNFRELEQCVRNFFIRKNYTPHTREINQENWIDLLKENNLSLDQLNYHYIKQAYDLLGSYEAVSQKLKIDRRTVKAKLSL